MRRYSNVNTVTKAVKLCNLILFDSFPFPQWLWLEPVFSFRQLTPADVSFSVHWLPVYARPEGSGNAWVTFSTRQFPRESLILSNLAVSLAWRILSQDTAKKNEFLNEKRSIVGCIKKYRFIFLFLCPVWTTILNKLPILEDPISLANVTYVTNSMGFFIVTLFLYLSRKHFLTICDVSGIVTVAWNIKMKDLVHHRHLGKMGQCSDEGMQELLWC